MKEAWLHRVRKPARYIGGEIHSVQKDLETVETRIALVFPDVYEVGMSHLGLRILYHVLNQRQEVYAERVFAPWMDMEAVLRAEGARLCSLETQTPLDRFDIVGITLPYELCYTNILTILDLGGIPLDPRARTEAHPLILGGGTTAFNPEPVAPFFDAIALGDGEEMVLEIVDCYQSWKRRGGTRPELLHALARIPGLYVPSLYRVEWHPDGTLRSIQAQDPAPPTVHRRVLEDLRGAPYPDTPVIPHLQTVHDRLAVEVTRGCTFGCRFCQAGYTYRPVREREPEEIARIVERGLATTGFEEVSLLSLSIGDYACLTPLVQYLADRYQEDHVALSLPSLRIGTLTEPLLQEITRTKHTGFTVAPEAGTERLRRVINKPIDEGELYRTVDVVFARGCRSMKLYFMIGLPTETDEDLDGIVHMVARIRDIVRRYGRSPREMTVSVSTFVPKAHTPFQWEGQIPLEEIRRRIRYLEERLRRHRVSFKAHHPEMSFLEAVFSRGDRRLARVIETAWRKGCRFDSWTEHLRWEDWIAAFQEHHLDPTFYANRQIPLEECLPWEHLRTGADREFLIRDYQRSQREKVVPDCRYGHCYNCGVCDLEAVRGKKSEGLRPLAFRPVDPGIHFPRESLKPPSQRPIRPGRFCYRLRYTKLGWMRWLSHLELMEVWIRALRRARLPVAYSEGYTPRPRISFGPALPTGMASLCEYVDLELVQDVALDTLQARLNEQFPDGLSVVGARRLPPGIPSLNESLEGSRYEIHFLDPAWQARFRSLDLHRILDHPLRIQRVRPARGRKPARTEVVDLRPFVVSLEWRGSQQLHLWLRRIQTQQCRPQEVLEALLEEPPPLEAVEILRVGQYLRVGEQWQEPVPLTCPLLPAGVSSRA